MLRFLVAALAAVVIFTGAANAQAPKPNILILLMDDQDVDGFEKMPFLKSKMPQMRRFQNFFFTGPLCCPSRASILTGMYPHNTGVMSNAGPDGGWAAFANNGNELITWARYLRGRGYLTATQGKYFNGYASTLAVPTGWRDWFVAPTGPVQTAAKPATRIATATSDRGQGYNFLMNNNGRWVWFKGENNYATDVLTRRASDVIIQAGNEGKPFANLLSVHCPHEPAEPAKKYLGTAANELPAYLSNPNYDEADVSDKPARLRNSPRLTEQEKSDMLALFRKRIECGYSVDDGLKSLWQLLEDRNLLDNTYIFVLSDNGFAFGHHRFRSQKNVPYVVASRSTLFVHGPGVTKGNDGRLIANIDIMPTLMQLAGARIPAHVDGRSLIPLLSGDKTVRWSRRTLAMEGLPAWDTEDGAVSSDSRMFRAYVARTATGFYTYHVYDTGEREYYNLTADPFQLENAHAALPAARAISMRAHLDALIGCGGNQCRKIENRNAP